MATDNLMPQSSTSIIKHFMLRSSTTGQGLTGKVASDFTGKYNIAGGAEVTLSFSSGSAGDAYSSGKICDLGLGKYAWHVPNAVFASLGNVSAVLSCSGGIDVHCEWLVVADNRDLSTKPVNVTQFGGTNLTAASGIPEVKVASIADDAITAAAIADAAIDTATFAAGTTMPRVTLVDTTTTNSDMRGTDGANTTAPDNAGIADILTRLPDAPPGGEDGLPVLNADLKVAAALDSASITAVQSGLATADELAKVPKVGATHRYTQVDFGANTTDVSIGEVP